MPRPPSHEAASRTGNAQSLSLLRICFFLPELPAPHSDSWGSPCSCGPRGSLGPHCPGPEPSPGSPYGYRPEGSRFRYHGTFRLSLTGNLNFSQWFSRARQSSEG